jgi:hypothetical protein
MAHSWEELRAISSRFGTCLRNVRVMGLPNPTSSIFPRALRGSSFSTNCRQLRTLSIGSMRYVGLSIPGAGILRLENRITAHVRLVSASPVKFHSSMQIPL